MTKKKLAMGAAAAVLMAVIAGGWAYAQTDSRLVSKIEKQFPNTKVSGVDCDKGLPGICEVTAGANVFYVTKDARYAFVGAVLDLNRKVDITDARLRELAAVNNAEQRINGQGGQVQQAAAPQAGPIRKINVTLPTANAIVHNAGAPIKLKVFTDLNCGYCRKLHEDLKSAKDIEVTEYPMAFLAPDSRDKARLALCAGDRAKAVDSIYLGGEVVAPDDCGGADAAVQANTEFGQQNGITGTPTIVRADGASQSGWMPIEQLRAWAKGAQA
nr:DsbC family protein [Caulobacter sp. 17J65-9]